MLFVQLVRALRELDETSTLGASTSPDPESAARSAPAPIATATNGDFPTNASRTDSDKGVEVDELSLLEQPSTGDDPAVLGTVADDGDYEGLGGGVASLEAMVEAVVGESKQEGSGEEGGGAVEDADNVSVGTAGAADGKDGTGEKSAKKKKKKKKKKSKAAKTTWAGEKDSFGRRLTLTARKEGGGGVRVEGLPGVLAASDISPVLLEAARAQLCHAVGDPDVDNLIALGYLQVGRAVHMHLKFLRGSVHPPFAEKFSGVLRTVCVVLRATARPC